MKQEMAKLRIGVDVGGTNTDAVILDISQQASQNRGVIACFKTPTTPDITDGIETAVRHVIQEADVELAHVCCVTIGTTHFINAVVEEDTRRLQKVAVIRLSKYFLRQIPPFSDWPTGLRRTIESYVGYVDGGLHIDGSEEAPIVEDQVVRECAALKEHGVTAVVLAGIFSPIDQTFQQELRIKKILQREIPDIDVVCSHEVANIGFLERENAAILNASILRYGRRTVRGFQQAMRRLGLKCGLYITQNDGTLLDAASAAKMPIRTFCSGATNSMRGAAYLGGDNLEKTTCVVIDIGGTTTDAGVLLPSGLPRQASAYVTVSGISVNYSMPLLHTIGLGGGSIVRESSNGTSVGPDSVGNLLTKQAMVFEGKMLTATDIAVADDKVEIGNKALVEHISRSTITAAQQKINALLESIIDLCKTSPDPIPVMLVGGGAVIAPVELKGVSKLIRPPFHDVANAVGAAVSKVSGVVDIVQSTVDQTTKEAVEKAKEMAIERAIINGAVEDTVAIAEIDSLPVTYMANQLRVIVKAVGELDITRIPAGLEQQEDILQDVLVEGDKAQIPHATDLPKVDPFIYRPAVKRNKESRKPEWWISDLDIDWLALGCYVLGCAGGGSPGASRIQLRDLLAQGHTIRIIDESSLADDALIYWGGHMGSPAVSVERLNAIETVDAMHVLMQFMGHKSFDALVSVEIGGANGMEPLIAGCSKYFDRPVVDCDFMGRAYPTYWQTTLAVHRPGTLTPCAIDSGSGTSLVMPSCSSDELVDRALRASCAEMGSRVGKAGRPLSTSDVRTCAIPNTLSLAWRIGRCVAMAEAAGEMGRVCERIVEEIGGEETARVLFRGKIVGVERRLWKGHSYGEVVVGSFEEGDGEIEETVQGSDKGDHSHKDKKRRVSPMQAMATDGTLRIPFKNENIYAEHSSPSSTTPTILASVPDLISILDTSSGRALGVPEFRYGLRVTVLGITAAPQWTSTKKGMEIGGAGAFGFDGIEYRAVGVYKKPRSVVEEFLVEE